MAKTKEAGNDTLNAAKLNRENAAIQHKIDFTFFVEAKNANPNGDPMGGMPRTDGAGYGEMTAECIARKIRNAAQVACGQKILMEAPEYKTSPYNSISETVAAVSKAPDKMDLADLFWDVRARGLVFGFTDKAAQGNPIKGPLSIQLGKSLDPVEVVFTQITKCCNANPPKKKGNENSADGEEDNSNGMSSDRIGMKSTVRYGVYRINGSIHTLAAAVTGFSEEDAEVLKQAILHMFAVDFSTARPIGSMRVVTLYWVEHSCKLGDCSSAKVFDAIKAEKKPGVETPNCIDDYVFSIDQSKLPEKLKVTEYEGW